MPDTPAIDPPSWLLTIQTDFDVITFASAFHPAEFLAAVPVHEVGVRYRVMFAMPISTAQFIAMQAAGYI